MGSFNSEKALAISRPVANSPKRVGNIGASSLRLARGEMSVG